MLVISSHYLPATRLASRDRIDICCWRYSARARSQSRQSDSSWLRTAYSGILDESEQDDVQLTTVLAPSRPAIEAEPPGELPPPDDAKTPAADSMEDVLRRLDALEKSAKPAAAKKRARRPARQSGRKEP